MLIRLKMILYIVDCDAECTWCQLFSHYALHYFLLLLSIYSRLPYAYFSHCWTILFFLRNILNVHVSLFTLFLHYYLFPLSSVSLTNTTYLCLVLINKLPLAKLLISSESGNLLDITADTILIDFICWLSSAWLKINNLLWVKIKKMSQVKGIESTLD